MTDLDDQKKTRCRFAERVLMKIAIFSRLAEDGRHKMAEEMELKAFKKGEKIVKKNERMQLFAIVWRGELIKDKESEVLRAGDWFGEDGLVNDDEQIAEHGIQCRVDTEILMITHEHFLKLFSDRLSFNWRESSKSVQISLGTQDLSNALDGIQEKKEQEADAEDSQKRRKQRRGAKAETFTPTSISTQQARAAATNMKTSKLSKWLKQQLVKNVLFRSLTDDVMDSIVRQMYCVEVETEEIIIRQGEMGDCLYCIETGEIAVFIDEQSNSMPVTTMARGQCVGELALMYDSPRAATCKTITQCRLWRIDRNDFKITLRQEAQKEVEKHVKFLKTVPILASLSDGARHEIAENLNQVTVRADEIIIQEGDACDDEERSYFYIIQKGKAAAYKNIQGEQVKVKRYGANESFGERALLTNEPRAATIIATTDVQLMTLSRAEFTRTMNAVAFQQRLEHYDMKNQKLMKRATSDDPGSRSINALKRLFRLSALHKAHRRQSCSGETSDSFHGGKRTLKDFKLIHGIGQGSFATVWLVRDKHNKETYALKRMSKRQIEDTQQETHVAHERAILAQIDFPFIVNLHHTFQDAINVYMVLDLGLGGDFFTYLDAEGRLSESKAKFFTASVVLAFEYLHYNQIIYRDLKPENIVLDSRGYLKLCDLGFAKKLTNETGICRTYTVCGTPIYLAPEIICGKGYSFPVDWWTVGIFLYECITGFPPFEGGKLVQTYERILHKQPVFRKKYFRTNALIGLVQGLLHKRPGKRFGCSVDDIEKRIKQHAWFDKFDWDKLAEGKLPSPYKPKLKSEKDVKYFDQDIGHRKDENLGEPRRPNAKWMNGF